MAEAARATPATTSGQPKVVAVMLIRFSQTLLWVFGSSSEMVILFQVRVVFELRFQRFTLQISLVFGSSYGSSDQQLTRQNQQFRVSFQRVVRVSFWVKVWFISV
ncbi:hypothetical protein Hanom_Chr10g00905771 [Helianthus anomalus]